MNDETARLAQSTVGRISPDQGSPRLRNTCLPAARNQRCQLTFSDRSFAKPVGAMTRILLVEDDEEVGPLLEHVLIENRYAVDRTSAVADACSRLESHSYDLVIAAARVTDGTGITVADRAVEKGVKALIITGYAFLYSQLPRYDFLLKPVRPDELLHEVERLLAVSA